MSRSAFPVCGIAPSRRAGKFGIQMAVVLDLRPGKRAKDWADKKPRQSG
jgi:hypothetical protein